MTGPASKIERRGLYVTLWGSAVMAVLGFGFAMSTHSQAILLDGYYSLVGLLVGLMMLKVTGVIKQQDDHQFQFGYAAFEPAVLTVKGVVMGGVIVFACVGAIGALLHGGRAISDGPAVLYAVIASAGCFLIAWIQHRMQQKTGSALLAVEAKNWVIDGLVSALVAIGFFMAMLLKDRPAISWMSNYVDPGLVILLALMTVSVPYRIIRDSLWEMLQGAPSAKLQKELYRHIRSVLATCPCVDWRVRIIKQGRSIYVLIHVLMGREGDTMALPEVDRIRADIRDKLVLNHFRIETDVLFTKQKEFME